MKHSVFVFALFLYTMAARGQSTAYEVSFPNAVHHEAEITATFSNIAEQPLRVRMSRSSPGRYATHEFAKNVYHVRATDEQGKALEIVRVDPDSWEIARHGSTVKVSYTLFGNRVDGTYTAIEDIHAHLNMPATFLWAKGLENQPMTVTFRLPANAGWKVATQLRPTDKPNEFTAPNLQYFMDSPTELSNFSLREWTETNTDKKPETFRLAIHHDGTEQDVDDYAAMVKRVVLEEKAIFGEWPSYDYGSYTFIQDVLPGNGGDGMEHRNSTFITDNGSIRTDKPGLLGTVSHEFFHSWNVERMRPRNLEPFDFERANMSGELWFAEGFTSYYGELTLARAGFYNAAQYGQSIGGQLGYVLNSPGSQAFSPVEMSQQAPFTDAATAIDPTNFVNIFTSYYPYGCTVALALDLTLRSQFKGLTLDDYMRAVWKGYGKPEKPYTLADLEQTLATLTKDAGFAHTFFEKHILGHETPDFRSLLAKAGFVLRQPKLQEAYLGIGLSAADGKVVLKLGALKGSPLYQAGLDQGDVLVSLNNEPIQTMSELQRILQARKPGEQLSVTYLRRGQSKTATVTLAGNPSWEVVPAEDAGQPLTKEARALRQAWLGSQYKP